MSTVGISNLKGHSYDKIFTEAHSGYMDQSAASQMGGHQYGDSARYDGRSARFLDSKGFGWLLETQDDDDDTFQRPLLLVLPYSHTPISARSWTST